MLGSWKFLKHCRYWRASMRIVPAGERTPHREESLFSDTPSAGREQNSELARASNLTRSHEFSRGLTGSHEVSRGLMTQPQTSANL